MGPLSTDSDERTDAIKGSAMASPIVECYTDASAITVPYSWVNKATTASYFCLSVVAVFSPHLQ